MAKSSAAADPDTPSTALAPRDFRTALAVAEGIDKTDARGKENISAEDITLPRIALAQRTSPEIDEAMAERYIPNLKKYEMFNTLTKDVYGNGPIQFVVLGSRKRAMLFDSDNKVVEFDLALDDPRLEFGPNGEKPEATLFHEFIVMLVPSQELAIISFKGTQLRAADQLATLVKIRPGAAWAGKYRLTSTSKQYGSFVAAQYIILPDGATSPEDMAAAEAYYNAGITMRAQTHDVAGARDGEDGKTPF